MGPLRRIPMLQKLAHARSLRRAATGPERHAWSLLRNRWLLGLKFRRQHVMHGFVVDFYCASLKLVLELEGCPHDSVSQAEYDSARAEWLRAAGYTVIRIRNTDLSRPFLERVIGKATASPPVPLSAMRRGGAGGEAA
jgi:very-short-patch-repair endonuclease